VRRRDTEGTYTIAPNTGTYHGAEGEGWKYGYMIARRSWESTSIEIYEENGET
jgi:hypothetical protein